MNQRDLESLIGPVPRPKARAGLKSRVLKAVRETAMEKPPSLEERLWRSTGVRLAWSGAVALLVIGNVVGGNLRMGADTGRTESTALWSAPENLEEDLQSQGFHRPNGARLTDSADWMLCDGMPVCETGTQGEQS